MAVPQPWARDFLDLLATGRRPLAIVTLVYLRSQQAPLDRQSGVLFKRRLLVKSYQHLPTYLTLPGELSAVAAILVREFLARLL